MKLSRLAALAAALFAVSCATAPADAPPPQAEARAPLIVVLIDGFRADYLDRGITPNISALAANGVRAPMRPSTPSVSAPNHYTLMTGLYPDHHGMVDNTFFDAQLGGYGFDDSSFSVPGFWEGATPLWVSAERQGVHVGSAMWGGPSVPIHGVTASRVMPYAERAPNPARVEQILQWFHGQPEEQPGLYLLYFSSVDTAGHAFGPNSPQVNGAIAEVDAAIGQLVGGLQAADRLPGVNIVLVADHGMTEIARSRLIRLADMIDVSKVQETSYGATLGINPRPGHEAEVARTFLRPHEHMQCWRKNEIPAQYHYGTNARVPAIFCIMESGWTISTPISERAYANVELRGNHGFDPAHPEMAALFVASGPAFRDGVTLPAFDNIHVYPMLAHVLGVTPEAVDGRLSVLQPALTPP